MTALSLRADQARRAWLQLRLGCARLQPGTAVAAALCLAGLAAWGWWVPHLKAEAAAARAAWQQAAVAARQAAAAPARHAPLTAQERVAAFYAVLGDRHRAEQPLETLFTLAQANGLTLAKGEYKPGYDAASRVWSYQASLPVSGSYGAIRRFCEAALRALPHASLDEIAFRREAVGNGMLEARLRFTLHLAEAPAAQARREDARDPAVPAAPAAPSAVIARRGGQP